VSGQHKARGVCIPLRECGFRIVGWSVTRTCTAVKFISAGAVKLSHGTIPQWSQGMHIEMRIELKYSCTTTNPIHLALIVVAMDEQVPSC
jgi:hypothetical protein